MATQFKLTDSILYPVNVLKMLSILGLILIFIALIGILGGFYKDRKMIHVLYLTLVVVALIYQISIAVIVYDQAAHVPNWLNEGWTTSTQDYKLYAQKRFNCCGYASAMDHPAPSSACLPSPTFHALQACQRPLTRFVQTTLSRMYITLFTSLAIELLALCNVITLLCTHTFSKKKKKWISPECNLSDETLVSQYPATKSTVY
ncbi:uncharacterized protein B0P05DRAFT_549150 [Gilbertella persicaria]|uniref:uncharacterized protein n=1 Tax=Gilbertella persicaria TaxID=101096 RepID=UPI00221F2848|nr:uncharacterized protein B0P05DRAFT_549150 [Gilbertella persicaria]KAI8072165.1 hypothetical protein B0P05DRAFT_549150 [Gilbertella persicaria]